jgi:hypothetical protein
LFFLDPDLFDNCLLAKFFLKTGIRYKRYKTTEKFRGSEKFPFVSPATVSVDDVDMVVSIVDELGGGVADPI